MSTTLVAFFSATGTTRRVAQTLATAIRADIFEITPKQPYSAADLDWTNSHSRSTTEMQNRSFRPEITEADAHVQDYNTIVLLGPIWWAVYPTIINTFAEKYDFSGKRIILFATSGGSSIARVKDAIAPSAPGATIITGTILSGHQSPSQLKQLFDKYSS